MTQLRTRVQRMEASSGPIQQNGCIRIIQDEELTPEQQQEIDAAKAAQKLVIIRRIVSTNPQ